MNSIHEWTRQESCNWKKSFREHMIAYLQAGFCFHRLTLIEDTMEEDNPEVLAARNDGWPSDIIDFYTQVSRGVESVYYRDCPPGITPDTPLEDKFCASGFFSVVQLEESREITKKLRAYAAKPLAEAPEDERSLWRDSFGISKLMNGDYISINGSGKIVYLCHSGDSFIVASSLWKWLNFCRIIHFARTEDWNIIPFMKGNSVDELNEDNINKYTFVLREYYGVSVV